MFFKKKEKIKFKLVTHDGRFHADDVFATAVLSLFLGKDNIEVTRTREEKKINSADYVYDVGGVYNESLNRFDHHQEEGAIKRDNEIPYSSFGLVWKKYGEKVSGSKVVADFIDRNIVQAIDAVDNGTSIYEVNQLMIHPHTLERVISSFLPTWLGDFDGSHFKEAVDFAKGFILREIEISIDREKAKVFIEDIYNKTEDKRLIILDKKYPYEDILNEYDDVIFVITPEKGGNWSVWAMKDDPLSFRVRKSFPKEWAGKTQEDLSKITGVEDAVFCHKKRFIVVAKSKEGAIKLAKLALLSVE